MSELSRSASKRPITLVPQTIGTPQQFVWLRRIILGVIILNALDAFLTLIWVWHGHAVEANPMMANLVHTNPLLFVIVKMALVALGSFLLWRFRKNKFAVITIFMTFLVYYYILLYHLRAMNIEIIGELFK